MKTPIRFLFVSLLGLLGACGEAVVGTSPYANTPPIVTPNPIPDVVTDEDTPVTITITLEDRESVDVLVLTGETGDPTLIDVSGFTFGGTGATRTFTLTPQPNAFGTTTVTLVVTDDDTFVPQVRLPFTFTVNPVNDPAVFVGLADVTLDEDGTLPTTPFTITDVDTPLANVTVAVQNSDVGILPNANLTMVSAGSYSYGGALAPDANGTFTLTFTADDGTDTTTFVVNVTVNAVNDAPTISAIADLTIDEDVASGPIAFVVGDVDDPASSLTLTAASSDATVIPVANVTFGGADTARTVDVVSGQDQFGNSTITVTVSDGRLTATETFVVTVAPINDAPVLAALADVTVNEDTAAPTVTLTVSDVDDAATTLVVTVASGDTTIIDAAGMTLGGTGTTRTLDLTPVLDANGATTITVTVTDPQAATDVQTFTFTVNSVNDVPTLTAFAPVTTPEDTATAPISFTIGDVETPVGSLVVTATSSDQSIVADGTGFTFVGTGPTRTLVVTPVLNAFGMTTVTVTVSDGIDSVVQTFVLTVTPVNDAPTVTLIADAAIEEGTSLPGVTFMVADVDSPLASLSVSVTSSNTVLVPEAPGSLDLTGAAPSYSLDVTPAPFTNGASTITVIVSDGLLTGSEPFVLTVNPVNDPPVISAVTDVTTPEDTTLPVAITVNDIDSAITSVVVTATATDPSLFTSLVVTGTGISRTLTIVPAPDAFGTTTITLSATDGFEDALPVTFTVTITPVNDAPVITVIADVNIDEDGTTGPIAFSVTDVDNLPASLTVTAASSNQVLAPDANLVLGGTNPSRTVTVTPVPNGFGFVDVTITVGDGSLTAVETFRVNVASINDPTIISAIADLATNEDTATGIITFTLTDVDDDVCALTPVLVSASPIVTAAGATFGGTCGSRTLVILPEPDASGAASLNVRVTDSGGNVDEPFVLTVNPIEDAPRITALGDATILEDGTYSIAVTITDPDLPAQTLTLSTSSSDTTVVANAGVTLVGTGPNYTLNVVPLAEQSGFTTITVGANDGTTTTSETFVLTVTGVDDAATIGPVADLSFDEDAAPQMVAVTVDDPDGPVTVSVTTDNPTLFPAVGGIVLTGTEPNYTITLDSAPNAFGTATVTITAMDTTNTITRTFVVTVNPINDPPTIGAITDRMILEDGSVVITLVLNDVEDGCAGVSLSGAAVDATLLPTTGITFAGTCPNRTVTLAPAANESGVTDVTIRVTDTGALFAEDTLVLTVSSVDDDPIATNDAFTTTGNVSIRGVSVATNDLDGDGDTLAFSLPSGTTTLGGTVSIDSVTGVILYTPPAGFVSGALDTFVYELTAGGVTVQATVTITITAPVTWFVDNTAPAAGANGTDEHPFPTLAALAAAPAYAAGHRIHVLYGDGTSGGYDTGFTLLDNCVLVGIAGLGGEQPLLRGTAGGAALTTGNNATIQGVHIEGGLVGIDANPISGTVRLLDVTVDGPATGVDIRATGTSGAAVIDGLYVAGTTTSGISIDNVRLTLLETNRPNELHAVSGAGLRIVNSVFVAGASFDVVEMIGATCTSAITITGTTGHLDFGTVAIETTGACNAITLNAADVNLGLGSIIDVGGGYAIDAVDGRVEGDFLEIACVSTTATCLELDTTGGTGGTAVVSTDLLTITTTGRDAVLLWGAGTFNAAAGTISATNGVVMWSDGTRLGVTLTSISGNDSFEMLYLVDSPGTFTVTGTASGAYGTTGGTLASTANSTIYLENVGTVSLSSIALTNTGNHGVEVVGTGTVSLFGCDLDGSAGGGDASLYIHDSTSVVGLTDCRLHDADVLLRVAEPANGTSSVTSTRTRYATAANDCIRIDTDAARVFTGTFTGDGVPTTADVTGCGDRAFQVTESSSAAFVLAIDQMDVRASLGGVFGALDSGGAETLTITGSSLQDAAQDAIQWRSTGCNARNRVAITTTSIGIFDTLDTGSLVSDGIDLAVTSSANTCAVSHLVQNSNVWGVPTTNQRALRVAYNLGAGVTSAVRILDNDLVPQNTTNASPSIALGFTSSGANGTCFEVRRNELAADGGAAIASSGTGGGASILEGFNTSVAATIQLLNPVFSGAITSTGTFGAGTCPAGL